MQSTKEKDMIDSKVPNDSLILERYRNVLTYAQLDGCQSQITFPV